MSKRMNVSRIIGVIGKPYGMKGFVFVRMVTDYPDTILNGTLLYLDDSMMSEICIQEIKDVSIKGGTRIVVKFHGYNSRDDVENLRGKELYRACKDQPALDEDTNWIDELIDCKVYLINSGCIGTVIDVENCAYNDNLIIRNDSGKLITIPMYDEYIDKVDVENKMIFLKELPEYI